MAITMQGNWDVEVKSRSAAYEQRFVIEGSDSADGIYPGETGKPPVSVSGAQWTITIEHLPTGPGAEWTPSDERLTTPTSSGTETSFDIRSNDSGADEDYNDLILTCTMSESSSEFVVYGRVRTYKGLCKFNPCFPGYFVVDSALQLEELLKNSAARAVLQELYPERIREYIKRKPIIKKPWPEPDPVPFRPMMIPMQGSFSRSQETARQNRIVNARSPSASLASEAKLELGASAYAEVSPYLRDLARIKDRLKPFCVVKDRPGLLLRFIEYDRTAAELAGDPYSGEGDRQVLGMTVTDEQGRYIFYFGRTLEDIAEEVGDEVPGGPPLATQLRPDLVVQIVVGMGEVSGVLYETALFADIPNLKRIDICIPESQLPEGLAVCQGGRAIQAIGNIWTISGMGNTLDADGRITATYSTGPQITRGAWVGTLDLFACFLDMSSVKYYTIRYRRPGGSWFFVEQPYRHIYIPKIGDPNAPEHRVGPDTRTLVVDSVSQTVPSYKNIETDPAWIATHRLRKVQLKSWLYERTLYGSTESPRTVEFKIEGYDAAGNKVTGAEDSIKLCIDNRGTSGDIDTISMGGSAPGECALFEMPTGNQALTVRFKVEHPGGFLSQYSLIVYRGSGASVPVTETSAPTPQPLVLSYDEGTHGDLFFGTFDAVNPDSEDYVLAVLQPTLGEWLAGLPLEKTFCAFAFEIYGTPRTTNGYWKGGSHRLDLELVGISHPRSP